MNPFEYQGPTDPARLIDRRVELDALQRAAASSVSVRLAAPRRFGKTSVLNKHIAEMRQVGHRAIRVDLSRVATVSDVAVRLASAYRALPADPGRTVTRWLQRLGVTAALPGGIGLSLGTTPRVSPDEARAAVLDLLDQPLRLNEQDKGLTVVCFDEFQDLLTADDALDGLFRSVIQHHGQAAAYVFAGSEPSLMRALFSDRERPFYGQARPLDLDVLPADEAANDIEALLAADGHSASGAVDAVVAFSGGHPQRTMLIAHHLYDLLEDGVDAIDAYSQAITLALLETDDVNQTIWDELDTAERIVLVALATGQAPTGPKLAEEHRVPRSTLQRALDRLAAPERHVRRLDTGEPIILDPLFAEWIRRQR